MSNEPTLAPGAPLAFRVRAGAARDHDTFKVEARALGAQQKEALLTEGDDGDIWRLTADEGPGMRGHDIAPFPLGYLIAGVTSDLYNRIRAVAADLGAAVNNVEISMSHRFGATGSFIQSTAISSSEAVELRIALSGDVDGPVARTVITEALATSLGVAFVREPLPESTFALYLNGRRRIVVGRPNSGAPDVVDPLLAHRSSPRPESASSRVDLIEKPGAVESGETQPTPLVSANKRFMTITGTGRTLANGEFLTETWINRPGMSHFLFRTDESASGAAPSGLGLLSTGIAFCYLTQLHRYIDAQKLEIHRPRLVQFTPFVGSGRRRAAAIDTHLFLNGEAPEDLHVRLLTIAADTCFMHAAAASSVAPDVAMTLNGERLA